MKLRIGIDRDCGGLALGFAAAGTCIHQDESTSEEYAIADVILTSQMG
jgi:hypothetical protein